jgi:hypothetical protein
MGRLFVVESLFSAVPSQISDSDAQLSVERKKVGPTDRSLDSFRFCVRRVGQPVLMRVRLVQRRVVRRRSMLQVGRMRSPVGFHNWRSLGTLALQWVLLDTVGRPSTVPYYSSYTCLTASEIWKREVKRIRKQTRACKPTCRIVSQLAGAFAFNTARIESTLPWEFERRRSLVF